MLVRSKQPLSDDREQAVEVLGQARANTPATESPTVSPLDEQDWAAVHAIGPQWSHLPSESDNQRTASLGHWGC